MNNTIILLLFSALLSAAELSAQTSTKKSDDTYELPSQKAFSSDTDAIQYYRDRLVESKCISLDAIYSAFNADINDTDGAMTAFLEKAGEFVKADICLAPKLGKTIQRVGYIIVYEHNLGFADAWFLDTQKGWRLVTVSMKFSTDPTKTLSGIPSEFFSNTVQAEQDGADQPAAAPESKSEGSEKPKPESEVRPK